MDNNKNNNIENNEVVQDTTNKKLLFNALDFHAITVCTALAFSTSLLTCSLFLNVILSRI